MVISELLNLLAYPVNPAVTNMLDNIIRIVFKFASQAGENAGTTLSVLFIYLAIYLIK